MQEVFTLADELGPAKILHVYEPAIPLKAVLVVDNVAGGPSIGGIRIAPDVSTEECFRLARAMTFKNAAAGLPHGGGKAVVYGNPRMARQDKERVMRALACALRDIREYILAPDMGTDEACMAWIKDEVDRVVGLPREVGGIPLDEIGATGWGLSHAAEIAAEYCGMELAGARVVVQGFGAVGQHAARFLAKKGALMVAAGDSRGAVQNPEGLDIDALIALKRAGKSVSEHPYGESFDAGRLVDVECEIWIPAARPDVIDEQNAGRLKAQLVLEGANIPVTRGAEASLHARGVLCVPDFIANAGGVICAAMEYRGATQSAALQTIEEKLRTNTRQVLDTMKSEQVLPRQAAERMALERVKRAMQFRRWSVF